MLGSPSILSSLGAIADFVVMSGSRGAVGSNTDEDRKYFSTSNPQGPNLPDQVSQIKNKIRAVMPGARVGDFVYTRQVSSTIRRDGGWGKGAVSAQDSLLVNVLWLAFSN